MICGLLGRRLGHSWSPAIHKLLADYEYRLFEKEPEILEDFLRQGAFTGLNVTMPYKQTVIPYLDELTKEAKKLGAVNTIVRRSDGRLVGHNTDYFGFQTMLTQSGLSVSGKKALVLGSGGAAKVCIAVLHKMGAQVTVISRKGKNNYQNLHLHSDATIMVNATPVGMYPNNAACPVDLAEFSRLEGVLDVIYNPTRTRLVMDAESRGIPTTGGLWMLTAQAKAAAEFFTGQVLADSEISRVTAAVQRQTENIILIGMPGCGKTTAGRAIAQQLDRSFVDTDAEIEALAGCPVPELLKTAGEAKFRDLETQVLQEAGKGSGLVIATGGGCVTKSNNYPLLHQNGRIFWLQRSPGKLATQGRPLSTDLEHLYLQRRPAYQQFADCTVDNNGSIEQAVSAVLEAYL